MFKSDIITKQGKSVYAFRNLILKNTAPEMPIVTLKFVDIDKILNYTNHRPRSNTGAPREV